jgi:hypothetical protein
MAVDINLFHEQFPTMHASIISEAITVKGIGSVVHSSIQYAIVTIYLPRHDNIRGTEGYVELNVEVHLVDNLGCHLLLGANMLGSYQMNLNFSSQQLIRSARDILPPYRDSWQLLQIRRHAGTGSHVDRL